MKERKEGEQVMGKKEWQKPTLIEMDLASETRGQPGWTYDANGGGSSNES